MHNEEWRPATWAGYEVSSRYEVSSLGRVRSKTLRPKVLSPSTDDRGYRIVCLTEAGGRRVTAKVHRLVCNAFMGGLPDGMTVNHIDGDKDNNQLSNLELLSSKENCRHAGRVIPTRSSVFFRGERMSLAEAVERAGHVVGYFRAVARIKRHGWDVERAVTTPAGPTGHPKAGQWAQ